jgi:glycosyltransferase involved in cell wall biosynthesis
VGAMAPDGRRVARRLVRLAEIVGKCQEAELPNHYAWGDVFLFPTIEDGFAAVLSQAAANGLPILASENCGAPDILEKGRSGWIVPIRRPDLLIDRMIWCQENREELASMVEEIPSRFQPPDWADMAKEMVGLFREALEERVAQRQIR